MPFYEIQHSYPLTPTQRQTIAERITTLHSTTFSAPSLFVNVQFKPVSADEDYFYGGKRRTNTNRIFAYVRSGPSRGAEAFDKLGADIEKIWDEVVGRKESDFGPGNEKVLQAVFLVPGIMGREEGFAIPSAGQEVPWLEKHWFEFQKRADAGDEDMKGLVEEVKSRPELRERAEWVRWD